MFRLVHLTLWLVAAAVLAPAPVLAQEDGRRDLGVEAGVERPADAVERTGGRVALVLGNTQYPGRAALINPVNDARDMSGVLEELGFTVVTEYDHGRQDALAAIDRFATMARGADVALLFYAGHGVEVGGQNYLIPVDFGEGMRESRSASEVALPLNTALSALSGAHFRVVILDACRNAPEGFEGDGTAAGWAPPPTEDGGTIVIYGTAPGQTSSDNSSGRNGLFTGALLEEIREEHEVGEMMRRVTRRVREMSRRQLAARGETGRAQSPWFTGSYVLPFYFADPDDTRGPTRDDADLSDIERRAADGKAAYLSGDYDAARPDLERAAEAGHVESQYYIGAMYAQGRGYPEDRDRAFDWFQMAARQGNPKAQHALGAMYSGGFGRARRDDRRALELYLRAAEQDFAASQFRLGYIYQKGDRGTPRDIDQAIRWYTLAAEHAFRTDPEGQNARELEIARDAREALEQLAADGHPAARAALRHL